MHDRSIGKKPIKISFTDKLMSAYGGFSLLSHLFEKLDFENEVNEMIPFQETSPNSCGVFAKIVKIGLTTMAGGNRFTHSIFLGDSLDVYENVFGIERMPKSISALTRFFNKFSCQSMVETLSDRLWSFTFSKILPENVKEDFLSFDSSIVTRYGDQEGAKKGYNPKKKGRHSHHPIFAFLNRSKYIVNLWNRSGDCSSGNGIVDFATQTLTRLDGRVSIKGVMADSGYYKVDFIDFLESRSHDYVIAAPMIGPIQAQVYSLESWTQVDEGIYIGEFEFEHQDGKWTKPRRYLVVKQAINQLKAAKGKKLSLFPEEDEKIFNWRYGVYITSSDRDAMELWRQYRLRAGDENIIKENKQDFGLEGYAQESFYATEASMLIRIMFYNIFNLFRSKFLPEPESKQTLHTIRSKYFIIPSLLGKDGRSPVLRLGIRKENVRAKFSKIIDNITEYFSKGIAFGSPPTKDS